MSKAKRARLILAISSVVASVGGVNLPAMLAAPGDIYNLGTLGGLDSTSYGYAINDTGQVTGYSHTSGNSTYHAFRYTGTPGAGGAMEDLGTLGGPNSFGYAINDAGQVAGASDAHAFRYTGTPGSGGAIADLGTLGGTASYGYAINNAGQVAGNSQTAGNEFTHAFLYTGTPGSDGAMVDLGTLGGAASDGYAINDAGQVAGAAHPTSSNDEHAFRYSGAPGSGGTMQDLGTLGGAASTGYAINNAGQVTGRSGTSGDAGPRAFRYTGTPGSGGTIEELGTLGGTESRGLGINDAGFVVGEARRSAAAGHANAVALWLTDAANTVVDLNAWLDATNPTHWWTLNDALGINNNGLITGHGSYNDGAGGLNDGVRAYVLEASNFILSPPTWAVDDDGNWSTATNWSGGVPNGTWDVANFGEVITAPTTVTMDSGHTVATINFDNADHSYTIAGSPGAPELTVQGSVGVINVVSGSHFISAPLALTTQTEFRVGSGNTLTVSNLQSSSVIITKRGAGKLSVNGVRASGLTISAGDVEVLSSGNTNANASRVSILSMGSPSATLDLNESDLIVDGGNAQLIETLVKKGYNNGDWLGNGITSSAAAAETPPGRYALGIVNNADIGYTEFSGFTDLNGDEILVKYTFYGDADLGGTVNLDDFNQFLFGYNNGTGGPPAIWLNGDFDYNQSINLDDFNQFLFGLQNQGGAQVSPELFAALAQFVRGEDMDVDLSSVPEPSAGGVLGVAMAMLMRRRRSN